MWTARDFTMRFCERWLAKAALCDSTSVDGAFDRFFSLFVAFNRLYSDLAAHSGRHGDRWQATTGFLRNVGTAELHRALEAGGGHDLRILAGLIGPNGGFYVAAQQNADAPDMGRNQRLYASLRRGSPFQRVKAALDYLYLVRCNMFHGHKDFDYAQLQIIQPSARCLERVVRAGLEKLGAIRPIV